MIDRTAVRSRRALRTWAHRSTGQASAWDETERLE